MLYNIEEYYQLSFSFLSYAIRGTQHRDTQQWVAALDRMRGLGAELMVPAHTQPLEGEQQIRTVAIHLSFFTDLSFIWKNVLLDYCKAFLSM